MKAGLGIRSCALRIRYTEASDTKCFFVSVKRTASSRGESSGSSSARSMTDCRTSSGIRFQTRARMGPTILETGLAEGGVPVVPAIEGRLRDAEHLQRAFRRQVRLLDEPDDLQLFGGRIPHSWSPPSPIMLFFH